MSGVAGKACWPLAISILFGVPIILFGIIPFIIFSFVPFIYYQLKGHFIRSILIVTFLSAIIFIAQSIGFTAIGSYLLEVISTICKPLFVIIIMLCCLSGVAEERTSPKHKDYWEERAEGKMWEEKQRWREIREKEQKERESKYGSY